MWDDWIEDLKKYVDEEGNLTETGRALVERLGAFWDSVQQEFRRRGEAAAAEREGERMVLPQEGATPFTIPARYACPDCKGVMKYVLPPGAQGIPGFSVEDAPVECARCHVKYREQDRVDRDGFGNPWIRRTLILLEKPEKDISENDPTTEDLYQGQQVVVECSECGNTFSMAYKDYLVEYEDGTPHVCRACTPGPEEGSPADAGQATPGPETS